jgi:trans-2-enoyl-CoA reductase
MRKKQTAAMSLFGLLNNMAKIMKDSGDEHYSNVLKHICDEYAGVTIKTEKEQIINAYNQNITGLDKIEQEECGLDWANDYYNETYGK